MLKVNSICFFGSLIELGNDPPDPVIISKIAIPATMRLLKDVKVQREGMGSEKYCHDFIYRPKSAKI